MRNLFNAYGNFLFNYNQLSSALFLSGKALGGLPDYKVTS